MLCASALLLQTAASIPPVDLNHFFITVDQKTFDAIRDSKWLKESFAEVAEGTNSSGDRTWKGLYVYGVGSYVEIFAPDDRHKEGSAGVGFLTPSTGGADKIYGLFCKSSFGGRAEHELMMLGSKTKQARFAHTVSYSGQAKTNLNLWLMEYHADYYKSQGVSVGSSEAEVFASDRSKHKITFGGMMGDLRSLTLRPIGDGRDAQLALSLIGFRQVEASRTWRRGENEVMVLPSSASKRPTPSPLPGFRCGKNPMHRTLSDSESGRN